MSNMNIAQIKTFLAVARTNSFSEASFALYISQSSVSKHIMALEREFGAKLFTRKKRKIQITEFGTHFLEQAQIINECYSNMEISAKYIRYKDNHTIKVVTIPILSTPFFADIFDKYKSEHEDITLTIDEREPAQVASAIKSGLYDYGIVRDFYKDISEFHTWPIAHSRLVAIVPSNHPLADRGTIKLEQLKDEKFISIYQESRIPSHILECCKSAGFVPKVEYSLKRITNVFNYISKGKGITLIFSHYIQNEEYKNKNLVKLELDPSFESNILLVRNNDPQMCNANRNFEKYIESSYSNTE